MSLFGFVVEETGKWIVIFCGKEEQSVWGGCVLFKHSKFDSWWKSFRKIFCCCLTLLFSILKLERLWTGYLQVRSPHLHSALLHSVFQNSASWALVVSLMCLFQTDTALNWTCGVILKWTNTQKDQREPGPSRRKRSTPLEITKWSIGSQLCVGTFTFCAIEKAFSIYQFQCLHHLKRQCR